MAIEKQVNILRRGVAVWNAWRRLNQSETIDFSEANLSGTILSGANLSGANLNRVNLWKIDLSETNFSKANLSGAILNGAILNGADLSRANLRETILREADLSGANLSGANLSRAILVEAVLSGANLSRTDLSRADLSRARVGWTTFGSLDLRTVKGLVTIHHVGPSTIGTDTLSRSHGDIPKVFLRGIGLDDIFIEYIRSLTSKPIEYYTCFISYSSKDERFAKRLHNDLQQEGVRCWFAPEDMDIGDKIRHRIEESIRMYDKLLLILSKYSIASKWVAHEVERALNKEPQGIPNVLYPVQVDNTIWTCTEPWAQDIKSTRHIGNFENWTDPQQYEESFKRLLRALNTRKDQLQK